MKKAARLMFIFATSTFRTAISDPQTADAPAAASASSSQSSAVDYNFIAQANLGAPFQIDSGQLAEKKGATAGIRDYAHLMVVSHVPVVDGLALSARARGARANRRRRVIFGFCCDRRRRWPRRSEIRSQLRRPPIATARS